MYFNIHFKGGITMKRRDFLRNSFGVAASATILGCSNQSSLTKSGSSFPKRKYKDNIDLSIIGFGGIVVVGMEQKTANNVVANSFDRGINYYDVAPTYGDGEAEEKLGKAIQPYRDKIFLACKTRSRDAKGAQEQLETSLQRIGVDHFDLYQFHAVREVDEVNQILGPAGAMETFKKAQEKGIIRYIGFSAHSVEAALALLEGYSFDSILFPFNFVCWEQGNFGPQVLAKAKEKGTARLALKAMALEQRPRGEERQYKKCWYRPVKDKVLMEQALRFSLSLDITAAVPPGENYFYQQALDIATDFKPLPEADQKILLAGTKGNQPLFTYPT
jgi:predicted aldo/keto reductase-like oxidoreductase